jgi:hypothetical protein
MVARLSRIVLLVRGTQGVASAVDFYTKCIGLQAWRITDDWAELVTSVSGSERISSAHRSEDGLDESQTKMSTSESSGRVIVNIQAVHDTESNLSIGYSPLITFEVDPGSIDSTVAKSVQSGAHLDGPIQYPAYGKVAVLRTPHGHMIGLFEPVAT